jgi:hypothetical protein
VLSQRGSTVVGNGTKFKVKEVETVPSARSGPGFTNRTVISRSSPATGGSGFKESSDTEKILVPELQSLMTALTLKRFKKSTGKKSIHQEPILYYIFC